MEKQISKLETAQREIVDKFAWTVFDELESKEVKLSQHYDIVTREAEDGHRRFSVKFNANYVQTTIIITFKNDSTTIEGDIFYSVSDYYFGVRKDSMVYVLEKIGKQVNNIN